LIDDVRTQIALQHFDIKWDELERVVKQVEEVILDTYLVIHNSDYAQELLWEQSERVAADFWSKTIKK